MIVQRASRETPKGQKRKVREDKRTREEKARTKGKGWMIQMSPWQMMRCFRLAEMKEKERKVKRCQRKGGGRENAKRREAENENGHEGAHRTLVCSSVSSLTIPSQCVTFFFRFFVKRGTEIVQNEVELQKNMMMMMMTMTRLRNKRMKERMKELMAHRLPLLPLLRISVVLVVLVSVLLG